MSAFSIGATLSIYSGSGFAVFTINRHLLEWLMIGGVLSAIVGFLGVKLEQRDAEKEKKD